MPVNSNNYDHRGGGNYGIVLRCPNLVADRLIYFDQNAERRSWVIRDFITGQRLENQDSQLTVAQIEADANHDEFPPWHNAKNTADSSVYLSLRTMAALRLGAAPSTAAPNPVAGTWRPL